MSLASARNKAAQVGRVALTTANQPWFGKLAGGRIQQRVAGRLQIGQVRAGTDYTYSGMYSHQVDNPIAVLADKYGSDKGSVTSGPHPYPWAPHTYADVYFRLFGHCREAVTTLFECGIGTNNPELVSSMQVDGRPGASLRMWRDFFPHARVVGADIDRDILFTDDRIDTHYVDQTDPAAIAAMWDEIGGSKFDVIIDDGLHTFDAGRIFFENSIGQLADHGIYVIEDIEPADMVLFQQYFEGKPYFVDFLQLAVPNIAISNNNLIVIRLPRDSDHPAR